MAKITLSDIGVFAKRGPTAITIWDGDKSNAETDTGPNLSSASVLWAKGDVNPKPGDGTQFGWTVGAKAAALASDGKE